MFTKEYPKSCTMFGTSFEKSYQFFKFNKSYSYNTNYFVGSGSWISYSANIFYTNATDSIRGRKGMFGFRNNIYVQ